MKTMTEWYRGEGKTNSVMFVKYPNRGEAADVFMIGLSCIAPSSPWGYYLGYSHTHSTRSTIDPHPQVSSCFRFGELSRC